MKNEKDYSAIPLLTKLLKKFNPKIQLFKLVFDLQVGEGAEGAGLFKFLK